MDTRTLIILTKGKKMKKRVNVYRRILMLSLVVVLSFCMTLTAMAGSRYMTLAKLGSGTEDVGNVSISQGIVLNVSQNSGLCSLDCAAYSHSTGERYGNPLYLTPNGIGTVAWNEPYAASDCYVFIINRGDVATTLYINAYVM
jgi:hypothetical protein